MAKHEVMIKAFGVVGGGKSTILNELVRLFDDWQRNSGYLHMTFKKVILPDVCDGDRFPVESEDGIYI